MIKRNTKLEKAILQSGLTRTDIARAAGIHRPLLSMALHGRYNVDPEQQARIAQVLGKRVEEVFDEN